MAPPACLTAWRAAPWPVLTVVAALAAPAAPLHAQGLPLDPEAEARIQRLADRVKENIRNANAASGTTNPTGNNRPAPPRRPALKPAAIKPAPSASAVPAAAPKASDVANVPNVPEPAAEATAPAQVVEIHSQRLAVSLFDFEDSAAGFTLHTPSNWAALPQPHITLTDQAQQGQQALAVLAPEHAWLGVDLDEAVDFTALKAISYWLRADPSKPPAFAIKTGTQYDWCRLPVTAVASSDGPGGHFVRYEADVRAAPLACRHVDLSDVRGFFWDLAANTPVVLDTVELR